MERKPHKHLIIDGIIKHAPLDELDMKNLLIRIVEEIGMKVADLSNNQTNPVAWYCEDENNRGMTAAVILTTSHCTLHVWDNVSPNEIHFDLYSCSEFDPINIINILNFKFGFIASSYKVIDRLDNIRGLDDKTEENV